MSQSLFYWKPLCNRECNCGCFIRKYVTILILLETTLQSDFEAILQLSDEGHNPYFTGNHFATEQIDSQVVKCYIGHNPYFTGNHFATKI